MTTKTIVEYKELIQQWNYVKNTEIDPKTVSLKSHKKVWWICENNHEWQATMANRTSKAGSDCPYCANKKVLQGYNDLLSQKPAIAKQFDTTKNTLSPESIYYRSNKKYWWICEKNHSYEANLAYKIDRNIGCPYCSGRYAIRGENDLMTTHPHIVCQWSLKNTIQPYEVKAGSNKSIWWNCENSHEWKTAIHNRTTGKGCPYCANIKVLEGFNDLEYVRPEMIKFWDFSKNKKSPNEYTHSSKLKVWWKCDKGHSYKSSIRNRVLSSTDCIICSKFQPFSAKEKDLLRYIRSIYSGKIKVNTRQIISPYELDIYIPEKNIALEFNGLYWHSHNRLKSKEYHKNKSQICLSKNIKLINIWEDEWDYSREHVQHMLKTILISDFIPNQNHKNKLKNNQILKIKTHPESTTEDSGIERIAELITITDKIEKVEASFNFVFSETKLVINSAKYYTNDAFAIFNFFISHITEKFNPSEIHYVLENGSVDKELLNNTGFIEHETLSVGYWLVKNKKRMMPDQVVLENDISNQESVLPLQCKDDVDKIYDPGRIIWKKLLR